MVGPWCRADSPNARAYHLLESLDLGPDLTGSKAVGGLIFTDDPCPGNDYLEVAAEDEIRSASCSAMKGNRKRTV